MRRTLSVAALAAAAIALAVYGLSASGAPAGGRVAPALPRTALAGAPVTLPQELAGSNGGPVLVTFWASWCTGCIREASAVERFARSSAGRGRVVAVDWNDPLVAEAHAFVRRFGWTFPILRDAEGFVGDAYRIPNLPTSFVVDGRGRIRATLIGPQSEASLRAALEAVGRV